MELPLYLLLVDLRWDLGDPFRAVLAARLGLAADLFPLFQQFQLHANQVKSSSFDFSYLYAIA